MNRIGTSEKVKVFETLEGVTSLPVELTKGLKGQVKPNRDKIRAILSMSSVIELQRHLLTTVMENEVRILIHIKHRIIVSFQLGTSINGSSEHGQGHNQNDYLNFD